MRKKVAGNEARAFGAQKADGGAQLLRLAETAERNLRGHLGHRLLVGQQRRREVVRVLDVVRAHGVHRDAVAAQLLGERRDETVGRRARRHIGCIVGDAAQGRGRRYEHNAAPLALAHRWGDQLHQPERRHRHGLQRGAVVFQPRFAERRTQRRIGVVVDQRVDVSMALQSQLHHGRGLDGGERMRPGELGFVLAARAGRLERRVVRQNSGSLGERHPCRAVARELLDVGDQDHPVFQQHGDSSRLRPMASPSTDPADPSAPTEGEQASFGYRDVPAGEKAGMVHRVFESVAPRYDLMNDLMSAGVHRLWKSTLVDVLNPRPGERLLDVAGGTGDIAFRILHRQGQRPDVTVCDINAAMLAVGRDRAADRGLIKGLTWTTGDAENLPFGDRSFDGYTVAFGLRNVTDLDKALIEAHRVLKPGGRFYCLEFSKVTSAAFGRAYDAYSSRALPLLGRLVAGDAESYRYLDESIRRFPPQRELARRLRQAGFANVTWRDMTLGVVALHGGWRI